MDNITILAQEFQLDKDCINKTIALLDEGNTIPFIARYRKEVTGGIDDQVLRRLADRLTSLRAIEERRSDILRLLEEQSVLTPELQQKIEKADSLTILEDLYRPFRPKRRTRASVAREKGLLPLAEALLNPSLSSGAWAKILAESIDPEKGVADQAEALAGAQDILAEQLSDDPVLRDKLRRILGRMGLITSKRKKKELDSEEAEIKARTYEQYFDYREPVARVAGHRTLAMNRGEKEGFLSIGLEMEQDLAVSHVRSALPQGNPLTASYLTEAAEDAWKRLLLPSLTTEIRNVLTEKAEDEAMLIFSGNLRSLLMIPPIRGHVVLALDPAYRTGCKLAVMDATGYPLYTDVIFPTPPQNRIQEAADTMLKLCQRFSVTLIAIGNGTASRETERFVRETLQQHAPEVRYFMVNEAGASVYSASALAAEEFPDLDLTKRSAISIGRRLQDPLAELVKIDPQSIGVGQYQHDMNSKKLAHVLGGVVEDCVNEVGVDLNTASSALLAYISGISKPLAQNIVDYRRAHGPFTSRAELNQVPRLGPKAFEQCAGFLRVPTGKEPLDNTRIHPESYQVARQVLAAKKPYDIEALAADLGVGSMTLTDIIKALENPGYDPREELAQPEMAPGVESMEDLRPDMVLTGVVRNVSAFGAFVDIGVHQDGLVHVSEMADRFIRNPMEFVRVGQQVRVRVLTVDLPRSRISLSMKGLNEEL